MRALPVIAVLACTPDAPAPEGGHPPPGAQPLQPIVGRTKVLGFTSPDAQTWTPAPAPIAEQFVSLGLWAKGDELWVSGLDMAGMKSAWDRGPWDRLLGRKIRGLVYRDGGWEETSWRIRDGDTPEFIDPQWHDGALWYIAREGGFGDPVSAGRRNRVRSSDGPTDHYEAVGVADPSPVTFHGERYVFVTEHPGRIVQLGGDPLQTIQHWPGYSVPFATVVGDELWLLAQGNVNGRRQPVVRRSVDGRRFSSWTPMLPWDAVRNCTSPVMGPAEVGWVLLCVDEG